MNWEMTVSKTFQGTNTSSNEARLRALTLFERVYRNPKPNRVQQLLGKSIKPLHELSEVKNETSLSNRRYAGTRAIEIDTIHGTLNRGNDFDYDFHPLQASDEDRWCKVAAAMMAGKDLPPIEVIQVGDDFFVKDGHHRVSVARALQYGYLDAVVEIWDIAC